ncbi:hypothetical protein U9M48_006698, partial [Paspalum notatum var. saurae]
MAARHHSRTPAPAIPVPDAPRSRNPPPSPARSPGASVASPAHPRTSTPTDYARTRVLGRSPSPREAPGIESGRSIPRHYRDGSGRRRPPFSAFLPFSFVGANHKSISSLRHRSCPPLTPTRRGRPAPLPPPRGRRPDTPTTPPTPTPPTPDRQRLDDATPAPPKRSCPPIAPSSHGRPPPLPPPRADGKKPPRGDRRRLDDATSMPPTHATAAVGRHHHHRFSPARHHRYRFDQPRLPPSTDAAAAASKHQIHLAVLLCRAASTAYHRIGLCQPSFPSHVDYLSKHCWGSSAAMSSCLSQLLKEPMSRPFSGSVGHIIAIRWQGSLQNLDVMEQVKNIHDFKKWLSDLSSDLTEELRGWRIESDSQTTQLPDATTNLQTVLLGGVPGAVGFDIVLSDFLYLGAQLAFCPFWYEKID